MAFHVPECYRLTTGRLASSSAYGNNGAFIIELEGEELRAIASEGAGWEHVSVSLIDRCPTWGEMCTVKALFWDAEDCVIQYHPPQSEYVNCHPYCLHLWRPIGADLLTPPKVLVGGG